MTHDSDGPITPQLCCAARAYLAWSQQDLAYASGAAAITIRKFELNRDPKRAPYNTQRMTLDAIKRAFERKGFEFFEGGFRHTPPHEC